MRNRACKTIASVAVVLVACIAAHGAVAQDIVTNGDFATGDLTGWVVAGGNASATVNVQDGYAYMTNFGEAIGLTLKQTTAVGSITGGEVYYNVDLFLEQADVGGVLFVQFFAEQSGVGIVGGSGLLGPFWPWNIWEGYEGSFTAPAGADFVTVQIMANTGAATGSSCVARVDNVQISQDQSVATEPSSWDRIKAQYR